MPWTALAGVLAGISLGTTIWQWIVGRRFPLNQGLPTGDWTPGVTVLKPLKGGSEETARALESWFTQQYAGPVQILFGVASANDPACGIVADLLARHPGCDAQLVCCPEVLGPNAKVSTLIQLELRIHHDVVIVSDDDVEVPPNFMSRLMPHLRPAETGLVCALYALANPVTVAMRWEAVMINADFWSSVLMGRCLQPLNFGLGAVMALKREALRKIGGFKVLVDYLADDFQLGQQVTRAGYRIDLCRLPARLRESPAGWSAVWRHQLRWARTIRGCMPAGHFFSIVTNATVWPLLWALVDPRPAARAVALGIVGIRVLSALDLQRRLTGNWSHASFLWLVPVKDLLNAVIWVFSLLGNRVEWRGEQLKILRGGRLQT